MYKINGMFMHVIFFTLTIISHNKSAYADFGKDDNIDVKPLAEDAVDMAQNIGMKMRTKEHLDKSDVAKFVPFTLFPTPVPRELYEQALKVQEAFAELYFRIASDLDFLTKTMAEVAKSDMIIRILLSLVKKAHKEGIRQPVGLMQIRSDYMIHVNGNQQNELKQIEVNIGSIGGFGVDKTSTIHRRMVSKAAGMDVSEEVLPTNKVVDTLAEGLFKAWQHFGDPKAVVLMVAGRRDPLHFDEATMEYKLEQLSGGQIRCFRLNLIDCHENLKLGDDFSLSLGGYTVGVVYYLVLRTGNERFITQEVVDVWRMIEASTAIKSPTIAMDLASTKKIQQVLAQPGVVEQFFPDPKDADKVKAIRQVQAGLWALDRDDENTRKVIEDAIEHPDRYVVKANRDGGGNNLWDQEMAQKLREWTPLERSRFILMERLRPLVVQNYVVVPSQEPRLESVVTELGIHGALLGDERSGKVLHNRAGGHLMRTKPAGSVEGGISEGSGFFDSPLLY